MDLAASFETFKSRMADSFTAQVRYQYDSLVRQYGVTMDRVWTRHGTTFKTQVLPYCDTALVNSGRTVEYTLNADKLAKGAAEYADATTTEWATKIQTKLGELESATVHQMDGVGFVVTGHRAGRHVRIEQTMILKSSPKGKLFNQFPSRIYLDGKFVPEKQYQQVFDLRCSHCGLGTT